MTRPVFEPSGNLRVAAQAFQGNRLARRRYPSDWFEVGNDNGETEFLNGWDNVGTAGLGVLRYRDSGFGTVDVEGIVTMGPSTLISDPVCVLPSWLPLPSETVVKPHVSIDDVGHGVGKLESDGTLFVVPIAGEILPGVWYDATLLGDWVDVDGLRHVQWRVLVDAATPGWNYEIRGSTQGGVIGDNVFQLPEAAWPNVDTPIGGRAGVTYEKASSFLVLATGYVQLVAVFP